MCHNPARCGKWNSTGRPSPESLFLEPYGGQFGAFGGDVERLKRPEDICRPDERWLNRFDIDHSTGTAWSRRLGLTLVSRMTFGAISRSPETSPFILGSSTRSTWSPGCKLSPRWRWPSGKRMATARRCSRPYSIKSSKGGSSPPASICPPSSPSSGTISRMEV